MFIQEYFIIHLVKIQLLHSYFIGDDKLHADSDRILDMTGIKYKINKISEMKYYCQFWQSVSNIKFLNID